MRVWQLGVLVALLVLLAGCGGTAPGSGSATVTLNWPGPSRLIPFAANSIQVSLSRGGVSLASALLVRPVSGGNATVTFDRISSGAATLTANAYPGDDGTGAAQASATVPVTIVTGQTTRVALDLTSTIDSVTMGPDEPVVGVGGQIRVIATPRSADGEPILVTPSTLAYSTDAPSIARVDAFGLVTGVSPGTVHVTVRETESGRSGTIAVEVAQFGYILWEDFDDDLRDAGRWAIEADGRGPSTAETNGRLAITVPADSAGFEVFDSGYRSLFQLKGDFDIQVDYQLLTWPAHNGVRMGIWVGDGVTRDFMIAHRVSYLGTTQPLEAVEAAFKPYGGGAQDIGQVAFNGLSGKLRIVRTAGVFSGYYWDAVDGDWILIKSGHNFDGDMTVHLMAWSDDGGFGDKAVKVAFDNFVINTGRVAYP